MGHMLAQKGAICSCVWRVCWAWPAREVLAGPAWGPERRRVRKAIDHAMEWLGFEEQGRPTAGGVQGLLCALALGVGMLAMGLVERL
jgi:hypothetical protein